MRSTSSSATRLPARSTLRRFRGGSSCCVRTGGSRSATLPCMAFVPAARHLLKARDLAHLSRELARAFGESPHAYLLTRRLERAASLLRGTEHSVMDVCLSVGLKSV